MRIVKDVMTLLTGVLCATAVTLFIALLMSVGSSISNEAEAAVYYPDDKTVIASWERTTEALPDIRSMQQELRKARSLNGSENVLRKLYRQTQRALSKENSESEWQIFHARLLQQKHQFDEAARVIDSTMSKHGKTVSSLMLLSTVEINRGKSELARKACQGLAGIGEPTLAAICLLDVQAQLIPNENDYRKLQQLRKFSGLDRAPSLNNWTGEILAAMALALGEPDEASGYLNTIDLSEAPLSRVALWADIQLATGNAQRVLDTLPPLIANPSDLDDAILVRLAQAETEVASGGQWQKVMLQRVTMREWREDNVHAAQLARYYLDVKPDPIKALHYAELNWEHGKTWDDKKLLQRADELRIEAVN